uniref:EF-hand domain-containing protein n=1 Tax=Tetraselmis chuii TaxID=63592 RepID=A0A7S1T203_9CHLO|mmetsp:Transcript_39739/g.71307  ORF Transcript_39739/g.71307 Transcript_39739/m.71307 type:complete len:527 (+) Transcript_39739:165-1745(+)
MMGPLSRLSPRLFAGVGARCYASAAVSENKMVAAPMVYIAGEEMTHYCSNLIMEKWIKPHVDTSKWEYFDLSCKSRDDTEDQVLRDAVAAGAKLKAIFKEPTITPSAEQKKKFGLKKTWGSPNGAMRRGWNGITISRDTIHIDGIKLGFEKPVLFERHAVGGEYGAGWKAVGEGRLATVFTPKDPKAEIVVVDDRYMADNQSVAVTYHNPLDNVPDLAHHFFTRCLEVGVTPYVVTKKTVFKWQESFWVAMKEVFDRHYKAKFEAAGLLDRSGGTLQHLISDAATMQIIRWTDGGFGMAAHNYDGDMLTDQVAQVHRSPGFITSNLIGKAKDGTMIKEFEASHGTVADMWEAHLRGEETSLNPLGMVEAIIGAMQHAENLAGRPDSEIVQFTNVMRKIIHHLMATGRGTRDLCGPEGLTTEQFVDAVAERLSRWKAWEVERAAFAADPEKASKEFPRDATGYKFLRPTLAGNMVDYEQVEIGLIKDFFNRLDSDGNGQINLEEFAEGVQRLGIPLPSKVKLSEGSE